MAAFNFVLGFNWHPIVGSFQQLLNTALASATPLTVVDKANVAIIQNDPLVSTQSVRWTDDGTTPTASVGNVLGIGDILEYNGDLSALQFIRVASGAQLNVRYYRGGTIGE